MAIRADFYMIAGKPQYVAQPLLVVCSLAVKALAANQPCLIFCESAEQADFLDDLLWEFDGDAFVLYGVVRSLRADGYGLYFPERDAAGRGNPVSRFGRISAQLQRTSLSQRLKVLKLPE